ncbi:hypothetical protein HPB48_012388 [Haemaphysalis longicornis]|uniref:phosphoserine transaminase n=1 Tax=Haemaphysalis longicornis TaxID=44386 RepID=A0A9J6G445_HAELO|nr:hypothetical protein HPB48_012388 [Haemaphysalis longicornis]
MRVPRAEPLRKPRWQQRMRHVDLVKLLKEKRRRGGRKLKAIYYSRGFRGRLAQNDRRVDAECLSPHNSLRLSPPQARRPAWLASPLAPKWLSTAYVVGLGLRRDRVIAAAEPVVTTACRATVSVRSARENARRSLSPARADYQTARALREDVSPGLHARMAERKLNFSAGPSAVPLESEWKRSPDAAYLYYCDNETIHGVEFNFVPDSGSVPLVCDMSSNILTRPVDVSKYGVIFAGAQKNLGMAGVTVVIIREDLIAAPATCCPSVLSYKINAENKSLYNTPPTYAIYILGLVLKWIKRNGGVEGMARRSAEKSRLIYELFDKSNGFYVCNVNRDHRSRVNIPFRIGGAQGDDELEKLFLKEAAKRNMIQLKGHRSVGGIRASVFNAMSVEALEPFLQFAREFEKEHHK